MLRYMLLAGVLLLPTPYVYGQVSYQSVSGKTPDQLVEDSHEMPFRHSTFQQAWTASQRNQRPILLYVTSDNCFYCKKMLRRTLEHPQISRMISEHVESFAFNATESPELAKRLGVKGFPATLIISPDRGLLYQIDGFVEPQEFASRVWPVFEEFEAKQYDFENPR